MRCAGRRPGRRLGLRRASATARDASVHLAAFSVAAGPGGTTTLTLYPRQVINPNAVRQALAEHGIPALVTAGKFCRTADQPSPGVGQVVVLPHLRQQVTAGQPPGRRGPAGPARS